MDGRINFGKNRWKNKSSQPLTKGKLKELYINQRMTQLAIGEMLGYSQVHISSKLKLFNIRRNN